LGGSYCVGVAVDVMGSFRGRLVLGQESCGLHALFKCFIVAGFIVVGEFVFQPDALECVVVFPVGVGAVPLEELARAAGNNGLGGSLIAGRLNSGRKEASASGLTIVSRRSQTLFRSHHHTKPCTLSYLFDGRGRGGSRSPVRRSCARDNCPGIGPGLNILPQHSSLCASMHAGRQTGLNGVTNSWVTPVTRPK